MRLETKKVPFLAAPVLFIVVAIFVSGCSPAKMQTTRNSKQVDTDQVEELLGGPSDTKSDTKTVTTTELPREPKPLISKEPVRPSEPETSPDRVIVRRNDPAPTQTNVPAVRQIVVRDVAVPSRQQPVTRTVYVSSGPKLSSNDKAPPVVLYAQNDVTSLGKISTTPNGSCDNVQPSGNGTPKVVCPKNAQPPEAHLEPPVVPHPEPASDDKRDDLTDDGSGDNNPSLPELPQAVVQQLPVQQPQQAATTGKVLELVLIIDDDLLLDADPIGVNREDFVSRAKIGSKDVKDVIRPYLKSELNQSRISHVVWNLKPILTKLLNSKNGFTNISIKIFKDFCDNDSCDIRNDEGAVLATTVEANPERLNAYVQNILEQIAEYAKSFNKEYLNKPNANSRLSKEFHGIQTLNEIVRNKTLLNSLYSKDKYKLMFVMLTGGTLNYGTENRPNSAENQLVHISDALKTGNKPKQAHIESREFADICLFDVANVLNQARIWKCPSPVELSKDLAQLQSEIDPSDIHGIKVISTRPWNKKEVSKAACVSEYLSSFADLKTAEGNSKAEAYIAKNICADEMIAEGTGFYFSKLPIDDNTVDPLNGVVSHDQLELTGSETPAFEAMLNQFAN